jgi:hypothetical protein
MGSDDERDHRDESVEEEEVVVAEGDGVADRRDVLEGWSPPTRTNLSRPRDRTSRAGRPSSSCGSRAW